MMATSLTSPNREAVMGDLLNVPVTLCSGIPRFRRRLLDRICRNNWSQIETYRRKGRKDARRLASVTLPSEDVIAHCAKRITRSTQ